MAETETIFAKASAERQHKPKATSIGYYDLEKGIGEGNFAKVKLATHVLTGQKVAIKIIDKNKLDKPTAKKLFREVRIMKLLNHKNIVRLYEVIDTPDELYLVLEYVEGGEIFDYLVAHGRMKEKDARKQFRQIVAAVHYCHTLHIIHRDLKAENLLLDANMDVKIADFGFSNQFSPGQNLNTWCGSPPYAAPELFQGKEYAGPEVDVWSLGVVLYVLVCGSLPFDGSNLSKLRARVIAGKFKIPFYMSPDCERLIKKMLVLDPPKRATLEQVMQDKWFTEGYENDSQDIAMSSVPSTTPFQLTPEQHTAVLEELEGIGMDVKVVQKALDDGNYDTLAATYYLVADKRFRKMQLEALPTALASGLNGADASSRKVSGGVLGVPAQQSIKSSKPSNLDEICEEGRGSVAKDSQSNSEGVATQTERKRNATEPAPSVRRPSNAGTAEPTPPVRPANTGAPNATAPAPNTGVTLNVPGQQQQSSARPTSHRRRATVTTTSTTASEIRSSLVAAANEAHKNDKQSRPSEAQEDSNGATVGFRDANGDNEIKELPPPRVAVGRVPSARSRAVQIANEFKPKVIIEPASAQTGAFPPEEKQTLPPIPSRARAQTVSSGRPVLDVYNDDDESAIPIDQMKKHLSRDVEEPRTARFTFSLNTTSTKDADQVYAEVGRVLKETGVSYTSNGLTAICKFEGIEFEVEVCRLPNLNVNALRFKRLAGNSWEYKDLLTGLISKMVL